MIITLETASGELKVECDPQDSVGNIVSRVHGDILIDAILIGDTVVDVDASMDDNGIEDGARLQIAERAFRKNPPEDYPTVAEAWSVWKRLREDATGEAFVEAFQALNFLVDAKIFCGCGDRKNDPYYTYAQLIPTRLAPWIMAVNTIQAGRT